MIVPFIAFIRLRLPNKGVLYNYTIMTISSHRKYVPCTNFCDRFNFCRSERYIDGWLYSSRHWSSSCASSCIEELSRSICYVMNRIWWLLIKKYCQGACCVISIRFRIVSLTLRMWCDSYDSLWVLAEMWESV